MKNPIYPFSLLLALQVAMGGTISDSQQSHIERHADQTKKVAPGDALTNTDPEPNPCDGDFVDLFADNNFSQWTQLDGDPVKNGWSIENGVVHRSGFKPGPIITKATFKNFDLRFQWKISEGGNSGVKYRSSGRLGLEYQILDDKKHRDGKIPSHRAGSIYALVAAPDNKPINPPGEWNHGRIVANGNRIEHWLNGEKVAAIEYGSDRWKELFGESKYSKNEGFGDWTGPILLQDHLDEVWFKNVFLRTL